MSTAGAADPLAGVISTASRSPVTSPISTRPMPRHARTTPVHGGLALDPPRSGRLFAGRRLGQPVVDKGAQLVQRGSDLLPRRLLLDVARPVDASPELTALAPDSDHEQCGRAGPPRVIGRHVVVLPARRHRGVTCSVPEVYSGRRYAVAVPIRRAKPPEGSTWSSRHSS